jgi:hypothetical protein
LLVGYFEGLDSERGIAQPPEADVSRISQGRQRADEEVWGRKAKKGRVDRWLT